MYRASNLKSIKILNKELEEVKEGVGYNDVPPAAADLYFSPKKDLSWTGLPEFMDDTVTDYSRPSPTVVSPEFVLHKKPCFNCGDFSHLANDCRRRVQRETTRSQKYAYKSPSHRYGSHRPHGGSMRPSYRPAGHRPYGPLMNPRRPNMNVRTQYRAPWVPTVNRNNPLGSSQNNIDDKGYWDSGCYRHMTGNISYLSDFEPCDGGYVSFGHGGCRITGKGTIKT
nr:hypothetical protein [Tanacetum cinerariifolium]